MAHTLEIAFDEKTGRVLGLQGPGLDNPILVLGVLRAADHYYREWRAAEERRELRRLIVANGPLTPRR